MISKPARCIFLSKLILVPNFDASDRILDETQEEDFHCNNLEIFLRPSHSLTFCQWICATFLMSIVKPRSGEKCAEYSHLTCAILCHTSCYVVLHCTTLYNVRSR